MEEKPEQVLDKLETSLCSSPILVPTGQNIEDISSITEVSDLNTNVNVNKEYTHKTHNNLVFCDVPKIDESNIEKNCHLPSQVEETLKANADLLTDKKILDHFLHPEHTKDISNTNTQSRFLLLQGVDYKADRERFYNKVPISENQKDDLAVPYYNVSSTPKKSLQTCFDNLTNRKEKHVNFANDIMSENRKAFPDNNYDNSASKLQRFSYFEPEIVLDRLGEIRNNLDLKDGDENVNFDDLPLSRLLSAKLNSQKQRTKDLEEELALNEASLTKVTCELEVVQKRLFRREEQLKEAGEQIEKLQNEWKSIQQKLINSRDYYRLQHDQKKKMVDSLTAEAEIREKDLKALREEQKEFSDLKVRAEGMKYQVERSSKQNEEVVQENERLNEEVKNMEEKLAYYEKELLPKVQKEKQKFETENEKLHFKLDNFIIARDDVAEELKLLKSRHSAVLEKFLEDQELKEEALKEKEMSKELVKNLIREQSEIIDKLRQQFHDQLESSVLTRYAKLQEDFESKEKDLKRSLSHEIEDLKRSFENEKVEMKRRNEEEKERLRKSSERKDQLKQNEILELKYENDQLQNQIRTIAMTISASVPPKSRGGLVGYKNVGHGPVGRRNEYNPNYAEKLKQTNDGDTSSDKENQPAQSPSRQKRRFGPLVASTSLSSVHDSAEENLPCKNRRRNPRETLRGGEASDEKSKHLPKAKFGGRKLQTASQILGSVESLTSSGKSSANKFFKAVDKEVSQIVQEINSMTEYVGVPNETPQHDTSVEQDSARMTLKRIDKMSDLLSKYVR